jgi:hypothetical protein
MGMAMVFALTCFFGNENRQLSFDLVPDSDQQHEAKLVNKWLFNYLIIIIVLFCFRALKALKPFISFDPDYADYLFGHSGVHLLPPRKTVNPSLCLASRKNLGYSLPELRW